MSKEEILEGNKLIAEFLGHKLDNNNEFDIEYVTVQGLWETCSINDLEYNSSWDWLMPVFDKFTSKFDISWKISSTMVSVYNPNTNINGRFEINCPENIIIDAWRGVISTIKDINKTIK